MCIRDRTNGSRTFKQGIEFSLSTRRIRALATKLIVSGAYFKNRYENSETQYVLTTVQLAEVTPYPYIGLYDQDDNCLLYTSIYAKPGNMTQGADGKTIDRMSLSRIEKDVYKRQIRQASILSFLPRGIP